MNIRHGELNIELPDEWLMDAEVIELVGKDLKYVVNKNVFPRRELFEVCVDDVAPVQRSAGVSIFNFESETKRTARDRVVSILCAFRSGAELPPVEVVALPDGKAYRYKRIMGSGLALTHLA